MLDRIFNNAVNVHGEPIRLAVKDGRLVDATDASEARETIDLAGRLVLPGFVDGHIHLDKSFVGDTWRPHVPAHSLRERLAAEKQLLATARPMVERADALIAQAASYGTMAMRCHVDVDATTGLSHLHAVMEARSRWLDRVDIEIVAFPQAGVMSCPGTADVLHAAMREGATVVGGIDPTTLDGDAEGQLDVVFGVAERHDAKVDIHLHEPGMQGIGQLLRIAARTKALGMAGRVAVSHAYALGDVTHDVVDRTALALSDAGVAIMTNAPGDRAFPPVLRLRAAGVHVFSGNDNIRDAWWPYGNGDMLQRAQLVGYRSGFYTDSELLVALDMATHAGATVMGKEGYGLHAGNEASFVVFDEPNGPAAVAGARSDRQIVHRGEFWESR
ncbi:MULTISPECIES: amidohydrolase family protein [Dyella]|uniref:Metal-dependent hydrolase n=2 Tax=Dyella TaxID=231454 RepID=A0A4R0YP68_9GAMM|nr:MULTISPECIES: amidohydrolase family protein [Dyella]TBR37115.1 metal-dependent hydrolase [Dyella terrae]TCI07795.1 metal-dependent hydrolase [Dyella soli]